MKLLLLYSNEPLGVVWEDASNKLRVEKRRKRRIQMFIS